MPAPDTSSARASRTPAARPDKRAAHPFFDPATFNAEEGVLWLLRRALVAVAHLVGEATELGGSTVPQWVPLYKIYVGQANTAAELARKCTVDAGSMTRLLDRMEERGLCRRVRSEVDRRVVHIELTPAGVAAAEQMPRVLSQIYNTMLAGFTPREWAQMKAQLRRVADTAEALAGQGVGLEAR